MNKIIPDVRIRVIMTIIIIRVSSGRCTPKYLSYHSIDVMKVNTCVMYKSINVLRN